MAELEVGAEYVLTNGVGGVMAVYVRDIEPGGRDVRDEPGGGPVAVLEPGDPVMRAWYCKGYRLGVRHWGQLRRIG